jgi:hypothetical protein
VTRAAGRIPVTYPFKSWNGRQTVGQLHTGQRVWDINVDGMAHYGLFPDIAGPEIVRDLGRGAEAYLQMWERADGVPPTRCQPARSRGTRRGISRLRLGPSANSLLRRAGQPRKRARAWTWCALGGGRMTAVLSKAGRVTTVVSTSKGTRRGRRALHGKRWVAVTRLKGRKAVRRDLRLADIRQ